MKTFPENTNRTTAVALRYDGITSPTVVASGDGVLGKRILELASEHGVPLYHDAGLASALSRIPLGEEIPRELYVAVAEVLAFVYMLENTRTAGSNGKPDQPKAAEIGAFF